MKRKLKIKNTELLVWTHNLKGYDAHFFISYVCPFIEQNLNNNKSEVWIAKSSEKFTGFDHGAFSFRDKMAHLMGSLADMAEQQLSSLIVKSMDIILSIRASILMNGWITIISLSIHHYHFMKHSPTH